MFMSLNKHKCLFSVYCINFITMYFRLDELTDIFLFQTDIIDQTLKRLLFWICFSLTHFTKFSLSQSPWLTVNKILYFKTIE